MNQSSEMDEKYSKTLLLVNVGNLLFYRHALGQIARLIRIAESTMELFLCPISPK